MILAYSDLNLTEKYSMDLEVKTEGSIVLLKPITKNLDASVSTDFKAKVMDLINQGNTCFLLDLSQVDFIDSSGLGAIISILKNLSLNNGNIVICEIKAPILNLFKLTRMDQIFKIYPHQKEAVDFLMPEKTPHS
ncbi:MAG: anti-anti-sigma factor [Parachlamydia sp.]|nr:MAG: anti-anti-sigma factor [Parachlamydia sp.]